MAPPLKIGLIGCGTIGSRLAHEIETRFRNSAQLVGIYDRDPKKSQALRKRLKFSPAILAPNRIVERSDLVIEAASAEAVGPLLLQVIAQRKSLLLLSTGGLLKHRRLLREASHLKVPVYLPSGALAGIDGVKAASLGGLKSVTLTTRKPPEAFRGAPFVVRRRIPLNSLRGPRLLFEGTVTQAVQAFPQNVNVAATLALAGGASARTRVKVVADPTIRRNIHEVEASGDFGRFSVRIVNRPSPGNPKTSRLALLSALATLQQILQPVKIGT